MTKYRPQERIFSATNATYAIYIGALVWWSVLLITQMSCVHQVVNSK